ncbi:TonB-dependent receptor [Alteriqipengyuania sp. 357]
MHFSPRNAYRVSALALAASICVPAIAQDAPEDAPEAGQQDQADPGSDTDFEVEILVTAQRMRGSVDTDVAPIVELGEEDIAAYGADSLADLISQLSPQTGSGRGRGDGQPVILVNGQRVASFRELRNYPPEAIQKVEVFPEEVALQYGYSADQRVVNIILKENFKSSEIETEYGNSFQGGAPNGELEVSQLVIAGKTRFNISGQATAEGMLTEAERDIEQTESAQPTVADDPDPAAFRSLRAETERYQLEGSFSTAIGEGANAKAITGNLSAQQNYSRSLSGLETVTLTNGGTSEVRAIDADPLMRRSRNTVLSGGGSYRQSLGDYELNLTLDAVYTGSESDIDRRRDLSVLQDLVDAGSLAIDGPLPAIAPLGADRSTSDTYTVNSLATVRGVPLALPAGDVNLTVDGGYKWNRIESSDTRTTLGAVQLTRGRINGGVNLAVPITSRRDDFLGAIGDVTLNLAAGVDHLSDFGTLTDLTLGLTWNLTDRLTLGATWVNRDEAPSLSQLGDPVVETFNVPLFDFATGDNVLATIVSGGNPSLPASKQNDWKFSANYELDLFERTNILVEYNRNRAEDTSESFPLLTAQIEEAFPDRVTRDGAGRLTALDQRPITFAERNSERIRYGFNMFGKVGKAREQAPGGGGPGGGTGAAQAGGQGGGGQMRMGPEQFQQMRDKFCASEPGTVPDLAALPPFIRDRLTNEDGSVNKEAVDAARERLCNADGKPGAVGPGGPAMFDPEQAAAIRNALCADTDAPIDLSALPEGLRARLTNEDGTINEDRLARLREAVCQAEGAQQQQGERSGGERRRGGGRRGGREDDGQGRWFLSLYHTIELQNEALIAPGIPVIDYFDLGLARHSVEMESGVFYEGFGTRLSGRYTSGYTIDGSDPSGASDLTFGDLVTFDLRFFMDLERQKWLTGEDPGFFKGTRVSLRLDNIFDTRQGVVDGTGQTPVRFQPALTDPLGRTFEIEFRKLF